MKPCVMNVVKVCEHDTLQTVGIHQMYNLDAIRDDDELIRFWSQKVKGQGHSKVI